jgi:glutathione-regulated potassium-efflux system ancillary protein KefC
MTEMWALAALWLGLALVAGLISIRLRIVGAMSEVMVGIAAGAILGTAFLGVDHEWIRFLAGAGAIVLVFLAGTELEPEFFRRRWKEATAVGFASFLTPFVICAAAAHWLLGWNPAASLLAGIAMSTTSVAVVYAVIMEFRLNAVDYGKTLLAACFVTDLGTVVLLGLMFAPFTFKTLAFVGALALVAVTLPWLAPWFFGRYRGHSEFETRFLLVCLFALGALAAWAGSEAVLPAFILGVLLAATVGRDHALVRRLHTLCFGLLTPFFFIRAGALVSIPALAAAPVAFLVMLATKVAAKTAGVYPVARRFGSRPGEAMYTSMLMSTGLTFGTIAALYGLAHDIVDGIQYSVLVAAVIASGVVPTLIANAWFLPRNRMPEAEAAPGAHGQAAPRPAPKRGR